MPSDQKPASLEATSKLGAEEDTKEATGRGLRFWLIFLALGFSLFLSPLELVSNSKSFMALFYTKGSGTLDVCVYGVAYNHT